MGFFDKLFSGSKQEPKKEMEKSKIRAQFKDEKYFNKEILRIGNSISNFKEDDKEYINQHGKLTPFHYISYCLKLNKKMSLVFLMETKDILISLIIFINHYHSKINNRFQQFRYQN